jgi:hypothetical protein
VPQLIEELMDASIRFVYFSRVNEQRTKLFADKLGPRDRLELLHLAAGTRSVAGTQLGDCSDLAWWHHREVAARDRKDQAPY